MQLNYFTNSFLFLGFFFIALAGIHYLFAEYKIPGNIFIQKQNITFYFPLGTCIIISIIISLLAYLFNAKT